MNCYIKKSILFYTILLFFTVPVKNNIVNATTTQTPINNLQQQNSFLYRVILIPPNAIANTGFDLGRYLLNLEDLISLNNPNSIQQHLSTSDNYNSEALSDFINTQQLYYANRFSNRESIHTQQLFFANRALSGEMLLRVLQQIGQEIHFQQFDPSRRLQRNQTNRNRQNAIWLIQEFVPRNLAPEIIIGTPFENVNMWQSLEQVIDALIAANQMNEIRDNNLNEMRENSEPVEQINIGTNGLAHVLNNPLLYPSFSGTYLPTVPLPDPNIPSYIVRNFNIFDRQVILPREHVRRTFVGNFNSNGNFSMQTTPGFYLHTDDGRSISIPLQENPIPNQFFQENNLQNNITNPELLRFFGLNPIGNQTSHEQEIPMISEQIIRNDINCYGSLVFHSRKKRSIGSNVNINNCPKINDKYFISKITAYSPKRIRGSLFRLKLDSIDESKPYIKSIHNKSNEKNNYANELNFELALTKEGYYKIILVDKNPKNIQSGGLCLTATSENKVFIKECIEKESSLQDWSLIKTKNENKYFKASILHKDGRCLIVKNLELTLENNCINVDPKMHSFIFDEEKKQTHPTFPVYSHSVLIYDNIKSSYDINQWELPLTEQQANYLNYTPDFVTPSDLFNSDNGNKDYSIAFFMKEKKKTTHKKPIYIHDELK